MRTVVLFTLVLLVSCTTATAPTAIGLPSATDTLHLPGYVRGNKTTKTRRVVIFVHGIFGNGTDTWTNPETHAYFPALVRDDPQFADTDIWVHEFPSPMLGRSYTIDELADHLSRHLQNDNVSANHEQLIFVAHSMGGIIVRDYLLKNPEHLTPERVPLLYFYSTPTAGAEIANLARLFSKNPQLVDLRSMTTQDPGVLGVFESHWQASAFRTTPTHCAYETLPTHGIQVVQRASATHLCSSSEPLARDHVTITKPASTQDDSYIAFRNAYRATFAIPALDNRPTWNLNGNDQALLLVMNTSKNPRGCKTCWASHATVEPGDVIALSIFAHNASQTPAYAVRTRLTIPSEPFADTHITAELRAPGTMPVAGSVYLETAGGPVVLVPSTGAWYPEATKDDVLDENLPYNQTPGDALTPGGFLLGDISPGWGHQATLVLRFRCIPITLFAVRNIASLLPLSSTTASTARSESVARDLTAAGHIERSIFDDQEQWVPDITAILNDEILMAFISDYNETSTTLHNVTATLTRTPTPEGEELHARITAGPNVRRTATATLSYVDNAIKREMVPVGMLRFGSTANPPAENTCFKSMADLFKNTTVIDNPLEDGIAIGEVPPKTGFLVQVLIVGDEPSDQVLKQFEIIQQSLSNSGLTIFDDLSLTVARETNATSNARVDRVMSGDRLVLTLHFMNAGEVPARATRARLATSIDVHTITMTGILHGTNTPAQGATTKIDLVPGQGDAHLQYLRAYRSYGNSSAVPIDALHMTDNGIDLGDIASGEEGSLQITYVVGSDVATAH